MKTKTLLFFFTTFLSILIINLNLYADGKRIPVCSGIGNLFLPSSEKSDSYGKNDGTIICWLDDSYNGSLFIQKMDVSGKMKWKDNGVMVDNGLGSYFNAGSDYPLLFSDNEGGAVIIYRKVFGEREDVYMQKIYSNGEYLKNPVCLSSMYGEYNYSPSAVLTTSNEIVITWENFSNGNFDIHAQKIDLNGKKLWNQGKELVICSETSDQRKPAICCNENNIILISWLDSRDHPEYVFDLYASALDSNGNFLWNGLSGKLIYRNVSHANSEKVIFYNHNCISSEKNSFLSAIEDSEDNGNGEVLIIKVSENFEDIQIYNPDNISSQTNPLIIKADDYIAGIIWNEKINNETRICGTAFMKNGGEVRGAKVGKNLLCNLSRNSYDKILPAVQNRNGICMRNNKIFFTWLNKQAHKLFLTSLHLTDESGQCGNTFEIQDDMTDGETTSITLQRNSIVIVYKQSNCIFASVSKISDDSFLPTQEKAMIDNFPNPFNPSTKIFFSVPSEGFVRLNVFDISGKMITSLVNEFKPAGDYNISFDGRGFSSGVYFCRMSLSNGTTYTKRMAMIK